MATDKDDGENAIVTYHIVNQEPTSTTPVLRLMKCLVSISLAAKLDYGKVKRYTLEVEGRDGGNPVFTGSASVTVWVEDVNDKAPVFSKDQYEVSVYETLQVELLWYLWRFQMRMRWEKKQSLVVVLTT